MISKKLKRRQTELHQVTGVKSYTGKALLSKTDGAAPSPEMPAWSARWWFPLHTSPPHLPLKTNKSCTGHRYSPHTIKEIQRIKVSCITRFPHYQQPASLSTGSQCQGVRVGVYMHTRVCALLYVCRAACVHAHTCVHVSVYRRAMCGYMHTRVCVLLYVCRRAMCVYMHRRVCAFPCV